MLLKTSLTHITHHTNTSYLRCLVLAELLLLTMLMQTIFYLHNTDEMRDQSATNAEYFIELGICSLLGFIIQNYCVAQVCEWVAVALLHPPSRVLTHPLV